MFDILISYKIIIIMQKTIRSGYEKTQILVMDQAIESQFDEQVKLIISSLSHNMLKYLSVTEFARNWFSTL